MESVYMSRHFAVASTSSAGGFGIGIGIGIGEQVAVRPSQRFSNANDLACTRNGGRARARRAVRRHFCCEVEVGAGREVDDNLAASHGGGLSTSSSSSSSCRISLRRVRAGSRRRPSRLSRRSASPRDVEVEHAGDENADEELTDGATIRGGESGGAGEVAIVANGLFQNFPHRYKLIGATSLAFVICNMDKVNMSVAIIPMSHQLGWNASTSGLVQSSFFWGYALSQLPGGFLAGKFSGRKVLEVGVLAWSVATALVPVTSSFLPGLLFCRLLVGLGEGVSPAAATDLIARTMPVYERARAVSVVFGGLNVGSVFGLLLAPAIIRFFGWEVVFYIFGILGLAWCLGFDSASNDGGEKESSSAGDLQSGGNGAALRSSEKKKDVSDPHAASFNITDEGIPWKAFFRDPAVWAMMYAHFCGNWGHYNLLSWLPTYFSDELNLNLTNSALVSILPPLGSVVVSAVASSLADSLIANGTDSTFVRKLCQNIAFLSPATCMSIVSFFPDLSPWLTAGILSVGSSLSTFALAGLYCTHQDISPKYASVLLGLTNTVGAVPGIFGIALTGYLLDQTKSWNISLLAPSIFFYVTGAIVWNIFASSEPKDFSSSS